MVITFIFLGFAFYMTYRGKKKASTLHISMLFGTTALCMGMVIFTLFYR